jgi:hypothetical protein
LNLGGKHHRGAQDPVCLTAIFRPLTKPNRLPAPVAFTFNQVTETMTKNTNKHEY